MQTKPRAASRARAAVALALLAVLGTACAPQHLAQSNEVLLIGDSLLNGAKDDVLAELTDAGWDPQVESVSGTTIGYWASKVGFLEGTVQPGVLVVELGTNDCLHQCTSLDPWIDQIMSSVPSSQPVLWLNVQEDVPEPFSPDREFVNNELEAADARWPNMYLIDFSGAVAGHPEWHAPDGVHFNAAGNAAVARFIRDELERFKS